MLQEIDASERKKAFDAIAGTPRYFGGRGDASTGETTC